MPSPLNGFTDPAASPTSTQVGPDPGDTEPPGGQLAAGGRAAGRVGGDAPAGGRGLAERLHQLLVFMSFQPAKVDRSPTPTLMVPSPTGKIQP